MLPTNASLCHLETSRITLSTKPGQVQSRLKETKGQSLRKKQARKPDILPLPDFVVDRLRQHLKEQEQRFADAGLAPIMPETPVFDYYGGFWVPNTFGSAWTRALKRAGLEKIKLHELRHTFGNLLREQGVDLKTIQKLMRHSDIKTTGNIYLHDSEPLNRSAIEGLNLTLAGKPSVRKAKKGNGARVQSVYSAASKR